MARYLIGPSFTKAGKPLKTQKSDLFRKLLIRQKIPFTERFIQVTPEELQNEDWDRPARVWLKGKHVMSYREYSGLKLQLATEFTFDDQGAL